MRRKNPWHRCRLRAKIPREHQAKRKGHCAQHGMHQTEMGKPAPSPGSGESGTLYILNAKTQRHERLT
jgi:hypothetical protein